MRVHDPGGPLPDKEFSIALDDEGNEATRSGGGAPAKVWQFFGAIFAKGNAKFFHRANPALRLAWGANQGAESHERLVQK